MELTKRDGMLFNVAFFYAQLVDRYWVVGYNMKYGNMDIINIIRWHRLYHYKI